jgi:hypothetical protein
VLGNGERLVFAEVEGNGMYSVGGEGGLMQGLRK